MKLKRSWQSTGHGTGAIQEASLRLRLLRDRVRKLVKRYSRRYDAITPVRERSYEGRVDFVAALLRGDEETAIRAGYRRRAVEV